MSERPTRTHTAVTYLFITPTASSRVSCSATSVTGKSMKLDLSSSFVHVSPASSWSPWCSCCGDSLSRSDADRLQSVKHTKS